MFIIHQWNTLAQLINFQTSPKQGNSAVVAQMGSEKEEVFGIAHHLSPPPRLNTCHGVTYCHILGECWMFNSPPEIMLLTFESNFLGRLAGNVTFQM